MSGELRRATHGKLPWEACCDTLRAPELVHEWVLQLVPDRRLAEPPALLRYRRAMYAARAYRLRALQRDIEAGVRWPCEPGIHHRRRTDADRHRLPVDLALRLMAAADPCQVQRASRFSPTWRSQKIARAIGTTCHRQGRLDGCEETTRGGLAEVRP